jgi:hypothetical protein
MSKSQDIGFRYESVAGIRGYKIYHPVPFQAYTILYFLHFPAPRDQEIKCRKRNLFGISSVRYYGSYLTGYFISVNGNLSRRLQGIPPRFSEFGNLFSSRNLSIEQERTKQKALSIPGKGKPKLTA